jgi:uncharacterized protein YqfA (UPF0365 family)
VDHGDLLGVRVGLGTLIGMRLRKVPPAEIVRPLISATKAGIDLDVGQMEAHYLAGGRVESVVAGPDLRGSREHRAALEAGHRDRPGRP